MIHNVQEKQGIIQTSTQGILHNFAIFLLRKYEPIAIDKLCVTYIAKAGKQEIPTLWKEAFDETITLEEFTYRS
jgi:hypothetical protein